MADITTIKFLSLTGLQNYDSRIKAFIESKVAEGDALSFKYVDLVDGVLKFYTVNPITNDTAPAFEIELPEQDLSHLMALVQDAVNGNIATFGDGGQVVDSGVALTDLATKEEVGAVDTKVDELSELVGDLPEGTSATTVIEYVNVKTAGIATDAALEELNNQVSGLQTAVQGIQDDYLTSEDKTELEGKIGAKVDQTVFDEHVAIAATKEELQAEAKRAGDEEARIEGLITAESERASKAESDLEKRVETMEVFWDTTEDADGVVNKLKEIQEYIAGDETGAAEMAGNIQANTQAIADMDAAYKNADEELQGNIDELAETVNGKANQADLETLAGRVTTNEGEIAKKANQADLDSEVEAREALAERVVAVEGKAHEHKNLELLETYTQTEENLADAVAKKHEHANAEELAKVADGDVEKWNGMEAAAASYTDAEIDKVEAVIGAVAENKTVVEMISDAQTAATYNDEEVRELISGNATDIENLEKLHAEDKQALEAKDTEIAGNVTQLQEDVAALQSVVHEEIPLSDIEALFPTEA